MKVVLPASRKGEKVDWYVPNIPVPNMNVTKFRPSEYGVLVKAMQEDGESEAKIWLGHIAANRMAEAQLATTPPDQQRTVEAALRRLSMLGGLAAGAFPVGPEILPAERRLRWQDEAKEGGKAYERLLFDDLLNSRFFRRDEAGASLGDEQVVQLRQIWAARRVSLAGDRQQAMRGPISQSFSSPRTQLPSWSRSI